MLLQSGNSVELYQFTGLSLEKYNPSLLRTRQVYASTLQVRSGMPRMEEEKGAVACPPCLLASPKISHVPVDWHRGGRHSPWSGTVQPVTIDWEQC